MSLYTVIANKGKDCWKGCKKTQGKCEWCGTEGWCCRLGRQGNGCDGSMGAKGMGHVCTSKKGNHRFQIFLFKRSFNCSSSICLYLILNQIDTEIANKGKDCWKGCEKTQGRCEWCGTEGWCCRLGWEGNGCDGSMGAKGMGHVCTGKGNHRCKIFCKFSFDFFHLA